MIYELPTFAVINDKAYEINSDFRCILDILEVLADESLSNRERAYLALGFFYPDAETIPAKEIPDAIQRLFWFINGGKEQERKRKFTKLMDWEQDFPYFISPINRIIGHDIRNDKYLHWWTFLSAYMDIGECLFSQIVKIRQLRADGKKLDKVDREWYLKNRDLVDLKNMNTFSSAELAFFNTLDGK